MTSVRRFRLRPTGRRRGPAGFLEQAAWLTSSVLVVSGWLGRGGLAASGDCRLRLRHRDIRCRARRLRYSRPDLRELPEAAGEVWFLESQHFGGEGRCRSLDVELGGRFYRWSLGSSGFPISPYLDPCTLDAMRRLDAETLRSALGDLGVSLTPGKTQDDDRVLDANLALLGGWLVPDPPPIPGPPLESDLAPPCRWDAGEPLGYCFDRFLSVDERHVFVCGWLWDPEARITDVTLLGAGGERFDRLLDDVAWFRRRGLEACFEPVFGGLPARHLRGFAGLVTLTRPLASLAGSRLEIETRDGSHRHRSPLEIRDPESIRRELFAALADAPVELEVVYRHVLPVLERLRSRLRAPRPRSVDRWGRRRAEIGLVAALPVRSDLAERQTAAVAASPERDRLEIVYVIADPEAAHEARSQLLGLQQRHGLAMTVVVPEERVRGAGEAWQLGIDCTSTPYLLLWDAAARLGEGDWLDRLKAALDLRPDAGAVTSAGAVDGGGELRGCVLTRESDADGLWEPRWDRTAPAGEPERVASACPGALLLTREVLAETGGFDPTLVGDLFVQADFCLALWRAGREVRTVPGVVAARCDWAPPICGPEDLALNPWCRLSDQALLAIRWRELLEGAPWTRAGEVPSKPARSRRRRPRQLRITHAIGAYLPDVVGGAQLHLRDLCAAQRHAGHDVSIFAAANRQELPELSVRDDSWLEVPVRRVNYGFRDCTRLEMLYSHPGIDGTFEEYLRERAPDIVHFHHFSNLSTTMVDVARQAKLATVVWLPDFWVQCLRGQRFHPRTESICATLDRRKCVSCLRSLVPQLFPAQDGRPLARRAWEDDGSVAMLQRWDRHMLGLLSRCDALLVPSSFHLRRFVEMGVDPSRCHVVEYGLRTDDLRGPPRGEREVRRLGYVGTMIPSKGAAVLLDAFRRLGRFEIELHFHGAIVPYHERTDFLDELRAAVPAGARVFFHGQYEPEALPAILGELDALVVPSLWWESYCLTAREGALAGLPVVAFPVGGLEEAAARGLALGPRTTDAAALARALERLLDDPELRDRLSRRAHLVRDIRDCAEEIEGIYEMVAPSPAKPPVSARNR